MGLSIQEGGSRAADTESEEAEHFKGERSKKVGVYGQGQAAPRYVCSCL